MVPVWHHFVFESGEVATDGLVSALRRAGLETTPVDPSSESGAGVLFFDASSDRVYEQVRSLSAGGRERVLAICVSCSGLDQHATWSLLEAGASDAFAWTDAPRSAQAIAARYQRWRAVDELVESPVVREKLVGRCPAWKVFVRQVVEAASFTEAPVLVAGESGTGKELAARLIHTLDQRNNKRDFVVLDCSNLVPELSGSEFFGHERGAFTGAASSREGAFALADGGTLFLDEAGELPLDLQPKLLRVLQEHTYKRVGGNVWQEANFRLVCATNRNLEAEVANGRFRADLYYRIAGVVLEAPPLRDRSADIPVLAEHFACELSRDRAPVEFDAPVLRWLMEREYKGNVRELKQVVARLLYRHAGAGPITAGAIPHEDRPRGARTQEDWRDENFRSAIKRALDRGLGLKEVGKAAEDIAEEIAIEQENGSTHNAALKLGVTDRALQMRRAARREQRSRGSGQGDLCAG